MGDQTSKVSPGTNQQVNQSFMEGFLKAGGIDTNQYPQENNDSDPISTNQIILQILKLTKKNSFEEDEIKIILKQETQLQKILNKVQKVLSSLYFKLTRVALENLDSGNMSQTEAEIFFAQQILQTIFGILKDVGEKTKFSNNPELLNKLNTIQLSIIKYLKSVYSRGQNNYVPYEIMKSFVPFNMIEQPEFDILEHKHIYFGSTDPADIAKTLKKMINVLIDESERKYPEFQQLLQNKIFVVKNNLETFNLSYEFDRIFSENASKVNENSSSFEDIINPQILEMLIKWLNDIKDYVWNPTQELLEKDYYKFIQNQQTLEFTHISPEQIESIMYSLKQSLQSHQQEYKKLINSLQNDLSMFNWNLIKVFSSTTQQQKFVSRKDAQLMKFSIDNSSFLRWILLERVKIIIQMLVKTGADLESELKKKMDLIKFNIEDMFYAQAVVSKKQIIEIFNNMKKLQTQSRLKIIKITNNLGAVQSDVKIVFKFTGCELFCQITLVLAQTSRTFDKKYKNIEFINDFFDLLEGSENGIMYELGIIINNKHSIVDYYQKLNFNPIKISSQVCLYQHPQSLKVYSINKKPFICTGCIRYYNQYSNLFQYKNCSKCSYFLCFKCISNNSQSILKQKCCQALKNKIIRELTELNIQQKNALKLIDISQRSSEVNLTDIQLINNIYEFYMKNQMIFLKTFGKGQINKKKLFQAGFIKKQITSGTLGQYIQNQLKLYAFRIINNAKLQFSFNNIQLNQKDTIKFGQYDFIILHQTPIKTTPQLNKFKLICPYEEKQNIYEAQQIFCEKIKIKKDVFMIVIDIFSNQKVQYRCSKLSISQMRSHLPDVQQIHQIYELVKADLSTDHLKYFQEISWKLQVKQLNLSNNHITDISILLNELINVEQINVSINLITSVVFTKKLPNLKKFLCAENSIKKMSGMSCISNAQVLNCRENYIQQFEFVKMPFLRELNLEQGAIEMFSMTEEYYPSLVKYFATYSYNHKTIPYQISLSKLQILKIGCLDCQQLTLNIPCVQNLKIMDSVISNLKIKTLDLAKKILFSDSQIKNIDKVLEIKMPEVQDLYIMGVYCEILPIIVAPKVQFFQFCRNSLKAINQSVLEFPQLKTLYLSNNYLEKLPHLNCINLEEIIITQNSTFTQIQSILKWDLKKLKKLILGNIKQDTMMEEFDFPILEQLTLEGGTLAPNYNIRNPKLKILQLRNIISDDIPLIHSQEFERINIQSSRLKTINNFSLIKSKDFKQISIFNCWENSIKIPVFFTPSLTLIQIQNSKIHDIQNLSQGDFPELKYLYLYSNQIEIFPVLKAPKLQILNLQSNKLKDINNLAQSKLPSLVNLEISYNNQIKSLPSFGAPKLKQIGLRYCQIKSLNWLTNLNLPELQSIYFDQNKVEEFTLLEELHFPKLSQFNINLENISNIDFFSKFHIPLKYLEIKGTKECIKKLPILNLKKLTTFIISNTFIEDVSNLEFSDLPELETLTFQENQFEVFPKIKFPKLNKIYAVYQQKRKKIKDITNLAYSELPKLETLQIKGNSIQILPKLNLPMLEKFFIQQNNISDLTDFKQSYLPNLSCFNICNNPITSLPLGKNIKAEQIFMTEAKVEDFTPLIERAHEIFTFYYTKSKISQSLPAFNFARAKRVQFQYCQLSNLDNFGVNAYPEVQELSFVNNQCTNAPAFNCPKVKKVFLKFNKINDISTFMTKSVFPKVQLITVQNNQIQNLVDFPFVTLKQAYFSHNPLKDISCLAKYEYHSMKLLVIYNTKVSKLYRLNTPQLERLFLNQNQIQDLSPLIGSKFPLLYFISLNTNKITDISLFQKLEFPSLKTIQLIGNNVQTLVTFSKCPILEKLNIKQNPIKNVKKLIQAKISTLHTLYLTLQISNSEQKIKVQDELYTVYSGTYFC